MTFNKIENDSARNIFEYVDSEYLAHHGIKGQRWGIRNGPPYPLEVEEKNKKTLSTSLDEQLDLTAKTRGGELLSILEDKRPAISRLLAKGSKSLNERVLNTKCFTIKTSEKRIGEIQIFQESDTSVNGVWLGIDSKHRGKGYAQAALGEVIDECRRRGYKEFTLEVPGNSPDARHIYEKMGFVAGEQITMPDEDFYWGGLTKMRLQL